MEDFYTCKKGFIITMDENCDYVPFFIYVRDKDIMWDMDKGLEKKLYEIDKSYFLKHRPTISGPTGRSTFIRHGWKVCLHTDFSCEITKEIKIDDSFNFSYDDLHHLIGRMYLPLKLEREFIDVNLTCNAKNKELKDSIVTIEFEDKKYIDTMDICLTNLHDNFPTDFNEKDDYLRSSVFATIHGKLKIENI